MIALETLADKLTYRITTQPSNSLPPSDYIFGKLAAGNILAWCDIAVTAVLGEVTATVSAKDVSFATMEEFTKSSTYTVLQKLAAAKMANAFNGLLDGQLNGR